jgi:hypothetical protein
MATELYSGIAVAALGGLSYLAYKEPLAYSRIFWPIFLFLALFLLAILSVRIGADEAFNILQPFLDLSKAAQIDKALEEFPFIDLRWAAGGILALMIYMGFLTYLPELRKTDTKNSEEK